MPDLGLEVLLKGKNMVRLLGGLGVRLRSALCLSFSACRWASCWVC